MKSHIDKCLLTDLYLCSYTQKYAYTHLHLSSHLLAGSPADCRQTTEPADRVKGAGWNLWPISQGQTGAQPLSWLLPHQPAIGGVCLCMWPQSTPHFLWSFALCFPVLCCGMGVCVCVCVCACACLCLSSHRKRKHCGYEDWVMSILSVKLVCLVT